MEKSIIAYLQKKRESKLINEQVLEGVVLLPLPLYKNKFLLCMIEIIESRIIIDMQRRRQV